MTERVRSADGTEIAFERAGDGHPLVVVGGALNDRGSGAVWAAALGDRFTVVTYDRRGRGDSGDTPPYAVEREVEDLAAIVGTIGGSPFALGHSSGAVLALEGAARGVPFERVAAYEPPFIVDGSRAPVPDDYAEHLEELAAGGRGEDAVAYFMTAGVGLPDEMVEGMRQAPFWPGIATLAHTLAYDARVMGDDVAGRPLRAERWAGVTVPVLVVDGGASPPWQLAATRALTEALADAEHRTLDGQTHEVDPAALTPVLVDFFAR